MIEQTDLHFRFLASVEQAGTNAIAIFCIALGAVLTYRTLNFLSANVRPFAKLAAWCYAIAMLGVTVAASL